MKQFYGTLYQNRAPMLNFPVFFTDFVLFSVVKRSRELNTRKRRLTRGGRSTTSWSTSTRATPVPSSTTSSPSFSRIAASVPIKYHNYKMSQTFYTVGFYGKLGKIRGECCQNKTDLYGWLGRSDGETAESCIPWEGGKKISWFMIQSSLRREECELWLNRQFTLIFPIKSVQVFQITKIPEQISKQSSSFSSPN